MLFSVRRCVLVSLGVAELVAGAALAAGAGDAVSLIDGASRFGAGAAALLLVAAGAAGAAGAALALAGDPSRASLGAPAAVVAADAGAALAADEALGAALVPTLALPPVDAALLSGLLAALAAALPALLAFAVAAALADAEPAGASSLVALLGALSLGVVGAPVPPDTASAAALRRLVRTRITCSRLAHLLRNSAQLLAACWLCERQRRMQAAAPCAYRVTWIRFEPVRYGHTHDVDVLERHVHHALERLELARGIVRNLNGAARPRQIALVEKHLHRFAQRADGLGERRCVARRHARQRVLQRHDARHGARRYARRVVGLLRRRTAPAARALGLGAAVAPRLGARVVVAVRLVLCAAR